MSDDLETGDQIEANLETGKIVNSSKNKPLKSGNPLSKVQLDIYQAGSMFEYGKTLK